MARVAAGILDAVIALVGAAVLLIGLTGGHDLGAGETRLAPTSVGPWAVLLGLLVYGRCRLTALRQVPSPPLRWLARAARPLLGERGPRGAAVLLIAVYGVLLLARFLRHWSLHDTGWDVGCVQQALFWPVDGLPLRCDICLGGTYLGEHTSLTFFLLGPLTAWARSYVLVFVLGAAFVAVPLWLALRHGPLRDQRGLWLVALLVVLCQRALRDAVVWDFREDHMAFAFLLGAVVCLARARIAGYVVFLLLAVLSKENVPLITMFLAAPILLDRALPLGRGQRWRLAAFTVIVSAIWGFLAFGVLLPRFTPAGAQTLGHPIVDRLGDYGTTPGEIVGTILVSPSAWWTLARTELFNGPALEYVLLLVGPFALFLRRSPWWLVPALPGILMNILPQSENQISFRFHYELVILPFLIMGAWAGMARMFRDTPPRARPGTLAAAVLVALALSGRWPGHQVQKHWPSVATLRDAMYLDGLAPGDAVVGATHKTMAYLSHVRHVRPLLLPEEPVPAAPAAAWAMLWSHNRSEHDRAGIPGQGLHQATWMVLDTEQPWERFLIDALPPRGWTAAARSPGRRFWILQKDGHEHGHEDGTADDT